MVNTFEKKTSVGFGSFRLSEKDGFPWKVGETTGPTIGFSGSDPQNPRLAPGILFRVVGRPEGSDDLILGN